MRPTDASLLVMANRGPDTNGSQFFVTLAPSPHLTGKHVVFGRVVHGLEHIEAIGKLATDERDRPLSPVVVSRAGELELRAAAPRPPSPESESEDEEERRRRRRERKERKEKEREERRAERKRRKERRGDDSRSRSRSRSPRRSRRDRSPSETLSELDARLEREEKERIEAERVEKLRLMKEAIASDRQAIKDAGGVVYKGRGTMRYRDPESSGAMPRNYDSRGQDTRARRRRGDDGGRWERGAEVRPSFAKGRDMDRWDHGGWSSRDPDARGGRGDRDRGDRRGGRDGRDDRDVRRQEEGRDAPRPLSERFAPRTEPELDYRDESERTDERTDRGPRMDAERAARADAWRSARRSPSPPPRAVRSPSRERGATPRSQGSDMVMDD